MTMIPERIGIVYEKLCLTPAVREEFMSMRCVYTRKAVLVSNLLHLNTNSMVPLIMLNFFATIFNLRFT